VIVRGVGVSVREGATTEHTDSDTRTQRERETHSPHAVCVGVSEVPMAQRAHRRLWKGQRHNAKGAVPKVKGRRSGESVGGRGRDNRHKGWKSSTPPQTVAFGARLVSCHSMPLLMALVLGGGIRLGLRFGRSVFVARRARRRRGLNRPTDRILRKERRSQLLCCALGLLGNCSSSRRASSLL
jgi:hypothetical protein